MEATGRVSTYSSRYEREKGQRCCFLFLTGKAEEKAQHNPDDNGEGQYGSDEQRNGSEGRHI